MSFSGLLLGLSAVGLGAAASLGNVAGDSSALVLTVIGLLGGAVGALWVEEKKNKRALIQKIAGDSAELQTLRAKIARLETENRAMMMELSNVCSILGSLANTGAQCATVNKVVGGCPVADPLRPFADHRDQLLRSAQRLIALTKAPADANT